MSGKIVIIGSGKFGTIIYLAELDLIEDVSLLAKLTKLHFIHLESEGIGKILQIARILPNLRKIRIQLIRGEYNVRGVHMLDISESNLSLVCMKVILHIQINVINLFIFIHIIDNVMSLFC